MVFLSPSKKCKVLSTYKISQLVENDGDDIDKDPDYIEDHSSSSSSNEEDVEGGQDLVIEANRR